MNAQLKQYFDETKAAFVAQTLALSGMTDSLANIAKDEQNQAKQIQDLIDQLAAGAPNQELLDALTSLRDDAVAMATKTQGVADALKTQADAIPDLPAPPTP